MIISINNVKYLPWQRFYMEIKGTDRTKIWSIREHLIPTGIQFIKFLRKKQKRKDVFQTLHIEKQGI